MTDTDLVRRRARSFGASAAAYAEHRPDYPADGVRWGLGAAAREVGQVLDLAAGTGKLTVGLAALGLEVTAVEPDTVMLAELASRFPGVRALAGSAERIPLPDASVDAVLVGQAFHWFDRDVALAEIARVLRPGGALAALWNKDDADVEWVAELGKVASNRVTKAWSTKFPVFDTAQYEASERAAFPHLHTRTADSLVATIGTQSHTLVLSPEERDALLERIRTYLRSHPETASGEFDLPLVTTVIRARRV
ncbi:MAG: methyltransferase domain-containing protein [Actinophytocola sp.]|uniref:class I SAM-dependent methyltransferase n=1 Tax=Actinophytocola sp. TaxID=1872138 RepID=UPI00132843E4|nr:class I SAM-dependent methyltransferase [Actinophytocola sp.]MPZ85128.1 methyltransferase domain-containing protein [Actinophytocola sp.]